MRSHRSPRSKDIRSVAWLSLAWLCLARFGSTRLDSTRLLAFQCSRRKRGRNKLKKGHLTLSTGNYHPVGAAAKIGHALDPRETGFEWPLTKSFLPRREDLNDRFYPRYYRYYSYYYYYCSCCCCLCPCYYKKKKIMIDKIEKILWTDDELKKQNFINFIKCTMV